MMCEKDKEKSEAEKLAEEQAREIWDSWITDSTETPIYED